MDSRAYRFIFPLEKPEDVPVDFRSDVKDLAFKTGVFLPQDDTNWFNRGPEYPARLLLLNDRHLYVVPHPSSHERTLQLDLNAVIQIEAGNILLFGWITFDTSRKSVRLLYNTRASTPLDRFLENVRQRWLPASRPAIVEPARAFGPERDVKFTHLLQNSLDAGEVAQSLYFCPSVTFRERDIILKRLKTRPGHLLAVTSRGSLLWLKDEYKGRYERYAGIATSAPLSLFQSCELESGIDHHELVIIFSENRRWRIPIYTYRSEALQFSQWLNEHAATAMFAT